MDILAVTHYPEISIQTFFIGVLKLIRFLKLKPCSFLSETDILGVTSAFLSLFFA